MADALQGYGESGTIDQAASWAAVVTRMRGAEPVGEEVGSLKSWHEIAALPGQFANTLDAAEQSLRPAAWAVLAATGGLGIFAPEVPPAPTLHSLWLEYGPPFRQDGRDYFNFYWTLNEPVVFWEAVPERSNDSGATWHDVVTSPMYNWISQTHIDNDEYVTSFSYPDPPGTTLFRVRMRVRNQVFGSWSYSNVVAVR